MLSSIDLRHNEVKVTPQNKNDLFILKDLITKDCLVTAKSPRSIKVKRGDRMERAKTGRKEVLMKVQIEKTEIAERLRLTGKILEAPDFVDKGYHTIEVEEGKFLTIEKEWRSWEIDMLKAAEIKSEPVLVCVLDDEEADFYFLKERYKYLLSIRSQVSGKAYDTRNAENKRKEYYEALIKKLKAKSSSVKKIIIAGPGFTKEDLQKVIKIKEKSLLEKLIVKSTFERGKQGLQELLTEGLLEKLGKMSRVEEETNAVQMAIEGMGKGKTLQKDAVPEALNSGRLSMLLVSDNKIREYEEMLNLADDQKIKIMIISSSHPAGERLLDMGGIAGIVF
ncbi:MAG: pelota family protein [Candidatus Aenigmarchaeota archaeon]|nr:pelota family protein [Candidatus Aenigmarchaeota archaeon]